MRDIRGKLASMIFQEPMTSLNPVFTIGSQIMEAVRIHTDMGKTGGRARSPSSTWRRWVYRRPGRGCRNTRTSFRAA